jgi:hypothetical protein
MPDSRSQMPDVWLVVLQTGQVIGAAVLVGPNPVVGVNSGTYIGFFVYYRG